VLPGAREKLLKSERARFLKEEWPAVIERMNQLGLSAAELLNNAKTGNKK
jgi:GntR family transcriptional regulator